MFACCSKLHVLNILILGVAHSCIVGPTCSKAQNLCN